MIPTNNTIPYERRPVATVAIVGLCIAAFAYQLTLSSPEAKAFMMRHALVPARLAPQSFLTSMFLHGGVLHILGNLWVLWVFGPALEDRLGSARFAGLYMASGLAAGLVHVAFNLGSPVPALGASGAIAGVIAAYARRFPYAWVNVLQPVGILPFVFAMPALMFAGLWFALQLTQAAGSMLAGAGGGIAWWAHIGGFVCGWLLLKRLAPSSMPSEEAATMAQSYAWPFRFLSRWWRWWWRRR